MGKRRKGRWGGKGDGKALQEGRKEEKREPRAA